MNLAWLELCRVPVSRVLRPSLKVIVPVGVPAPGLFAVTVAVKVTDCPDTDGLAEELTDVAVLAFVVVGVSELDVVPVKVAWPPDDAVSGCDATAGVVVVGLVVVLVGVGDVVVVEVGLVVVVEAPAGLKVASTMCQVSVAPKVRLPCCGPAAQDRMSSRSAEALPYRTSKT